MSRSDDKKSIRVVIPMSPTPSGRLTAAVANGLDAIGISLLKIRRSSSSFTFVDPLTLNTARGATRDGEYPAD